ncbi:MAG: hypothetical protein V3T02_11480 [Alphaproteobacteria bacterium]
MRVDGPHIPTAVLNHMGGHGKAGTQGAPSDSGADSGTDTDTASTPAAGTASGAVPPLSGATAVAAQLAAQAHGSHGEGNPAMIGKAMYGENPEGYKNLGQAVSEAAHGLNTSGSTPPVEGDGTPATTDETASDTADDTTDTADGGDSADGGETAGGDVIDILPDMPEPDPGILDQALLDAIDEASDPEIT